jgi:hypothetical protein
MIPKPKLLKEKGRKERRRRSRRDEPITMVTKLK